VETQTKGERVRWGSGGMGMRDRDEVWIGISGALNHGQEWRMSERVVWFPVV